MDLTANIEIFAALSSFGIALVLLCIAGLSYARLRSPRALLVAAGFLVLVIKGAYVSWSSWQTRGSEEWVLVSALLDLALALLLYAAIRKT